MDCDTIYHYCSLSTFLTIIDKKTLRLSNVLKSNDYLERKYVLLQCEDLIVDQILYQIEKTGYPCNETQRRYYLEEQERIKHRCSEHYKVGSFL